jgi:hypothetical protein
MKRRRFLRTAALLAAGTALGTVGCSSDPTEPTLSGEAADNKRIADSAAANDKAGRGGASRRKSKTR